MQALFSPAFGSLRSIIVDSAPANVRPRHGRASAPGAGNMEGGAPDTAHLPTLSGQNHHASPAMSGDEEHDDGSIDFSESGGEGS